MIFPSFFPGNLSGTWTGGQVTIDQPITILRIAATAKTPTGAACPSAVFRFTDGAKGQDLVLAPGAYWSDSGPIVMTFAAGATLQSVLRTGSTCASNTGADANLLVEYKMQAAGDTDTCTGTLCGTFCETTTTDPSNCGGCGTACGSGFACTGGTCGGSNGAACTTGTGCQSGVCTSGACTTCAGGQTACNGACTSTGTDSNNCGACGNVCKPGVFTCVAGACAACTSGCSVGVACTTNANCASNACDLATNTCVASQCSDQQKDGKETDIDCGGGTCPACSVGQNCRVATDCASNACSLISGQCVASQCSDQQKDGAETDVDCGGGTCAACSVGQSCKVNTDCTSNTCNAATNTCAAACVPLTSCPVGNYCGTVPDGCGGTVSCGTCPTGSTCLAGNACSAVGGI